MKKSNSRQQTVISGNARVVRNVNRAVILNLIRERQPISRTQIAALSGLNKSTVTNIVAELLDERLIYEEIYRDKSIGRNPINLRLRLDEHYVGALNLDYPLTSLTIADLDGSVTEVITLKTVPENPAAFLNACLDRLTGLRKKIGGKPLRGIGVSVAGIVDHESGVVKFAPHLGWEHIEVKTILQNHLPDDCFVSVNNDAKASALAELWFGKHEIELTNFVFLSVGEGIGAGIIIDKKLISGQCNASGEFGHMTLYEGGELCTCGNYGCWEAYASDYATLKRFHIRKRKSPHSEESYTIEQLVELARQGDKEAREALRQTGYYLGLGISNIIKALDPQAIILGGKVTRAFDILYPEIIQTVSRRAFFGKDGVHILRTSLQIAPRLLGAATLAIREIFHDYQIIL